MLARIERTSLAALGFALPVVFVPGYTGTVVPTGWFLLSAALPFMILGRGQVRPAGLLFLAFAAASLFWTPVPKSGVEMLWHWVVLAMAFSLGTRVADPKPLWIGAAVGVGVSSALAIPQSFGWEGIFQFHATNYPAGLFVNPNVFGEASVLVLIALAGTQLWWWIPLVLPGIILTGARGAIVGLVAALGVWCWNHSRWGLVALALAAAGALYLATFELNSNKTTSLNQRLGIWSDTAGGLTFLGHGVGSFAPLYPQYAKSINTLVERPDHAHNDFLQTLFEFGLASCLLWAVVAFALAGPLENDKLVFVAFLVMAFFGFPLAVPFTAFMGAFIAGRLSRRGPVVCPERDLGRFHLQPRMGPA